MKPIDHIEYMCGVVLQLIEVQSETTVLIENRRMVVMLKTRLQQMIKQLFTELQVFEDSYRNQIERNSDRILGSSAEEFEFISQVQMRTSDGSSTKAVKEILHDTHLELTKILSEQEQLTLNEISRRFELMRNRLKRVADKVDKI